jgi:hypothetical protein
LFFPDLESTLAHCALFRKKKHQIKNPIKQTEDVTDDDEEGGAAPPSKRAKRGSAAEEEEEEEEEEEVS